jgi:hypothetical protein
MEAVLPFGVAGESCCGLGLRRTGHLGSPENSRWLNKINKINPGKKKNRDGRGITVWGRRRILQRFGSAGNRTPWVAGELSLVWVCFSSRLGRRRTIAGVRESETRRRGRERGATEGERETERDRRGMDEGSPGLRDKRESGKEKNERDERNGGGKETRVFLSSIQKFKFFFFFFFLG